MTELKLPERGFTKAEREWLKQVVEAINTARVIDGRNIHSNEHDNQGTVVNANDCQPCS